MSDFVSQAEFARQRGWAKSYITKLKGEGRIVMDAGGKLVDVVATLAKLADTDGQARPDVAARHAAERGETGDEDDRKPALPGIPSKAESAAKREHFLALEAEQAYRVRIGELVEASQVAAMVSDVSITFRQSLENVAHPLAAELVGKDLDACRATLKDAIYRVLSRMEKDFRERLAELGQGDGA